MTEQTHDHDHPHFPETAPPDTSPTSNIEKYIKSNPMDMTVFESMRQVNNDFSNACRRIAEDFQRNYDVAESRTQWYIHLVRKKLHQGKKWSKGLVDALMLDLNAARTRFIQQQEAAANAEVAATDTTIDSNTAPSDNTTNTTG